MAHQINLSSSFFLGKLEYADMFAKQLESQGKDVDSVTIYERRANSGGYAAEKWQGKIGDAAELKRGYPSKEKTKGTASPLHIEGTVVSVTAQTLEEAGREFTEEEQYKVARGIAAPAVAAEARKAISGFAAKTAADQDEKITRIGIALPIADVRNIIDTVRTQCAEKIKKT
jgi:hypothetical protein